MGERQLCHQQDRLYLTWTMWKSTTVAWKMIMTGIWSNMFERHGPTSDGGLYVGKEEMANGETRRV